MRVIRDAGDLIVGARMRANRSTADLSYAMHRFRLRSPPRPGRQAVDMPATRRHSQAPGYRALRKGRRSVPGHTYLITTITAGRKSRFAHFRSARTVIQAFTCSDALQETSLLAWVLMPDHVHWLLQLSDGGDLSKVVGRMKGRSACLLNHATGSAAPLWQRGFHDHAMRSEEEIRRTARYIVANPLRAGLVVRIGDYPFWDAVWL